MYFLSKIDGFAYNGVFTYPSENHKFIQYESESIIYGAVEQNIVFKDREDSSDFILVGEDDLDYYLYVISTGLFEARDRVPLDYAFEKFNTFDELALYAIEKSKIAEPA